jgi:hypothetical protein
MKMISLCERVKKLTFLAHACAPIACTNVLPGMGQDVLDLIIDKVVFIEVLDILRPEVVNLLLNGGRIVDVI